MFATISRYDKELARHVHREESAPRFRSSLIHPRDPYPYEFSYANDRYIFMAEFICWEPRGGQRLITPRRAGPLLFFFLALFVFGDSRYAPFIVGSTLDQHTSRHPYRYTAVCDVYLAIDLKEGGPPSRPWNKTWGKSFSFVRCAT